MYFDFTWGHFVVTLILIAVLMGVVQGTCAYLILAERKISAWAQDRVGPNRVGREFGLPFGLLQPIADGIKFLFKEQVIPGHVDKVFYLLAPCVAVAAALLAIVVVPFGPTTAPPTLLDRRTEEQVKLSARPLEALTKEERRQYLEGGEFVHDPAGEADFRLAKRPRAIWPQTESEKAFVLAADRAWAKANSTPERPVLSYEERLARYNQELQFVIAPHVDIGVLFVLAIGSLASYGIVLGGWSSNNKYSLLGSLRSTAQMISYEIPLGMSILGVVMVTGSLNAEKMIEHQTHHGWNVLFQPVLALLFITSLFAECNRVPFDLPEAEQELVGGFHTEYSGMKFAMFFLGEYTHMIVTSFLAVALFFGGWHFPGLEPGWVGWGDAIVKLLVFAMKMVLFIIFYMFIRWTIPRFRFDQLMGLAWKVMMPLGLVNLLIVFYVNHFLPEPWGKWLMPPLSLGSLIGVAVIGLRMPPPRRANVGWKGHPVTGQHGVPV